MSYADTNAVKTRLGSELSEDPSDEIIMEGIASADDLINSELLKNDVPIPTVANASLTRAGNYLAASDILDSLNNTDPERPASAVAWEKRAYSIIEGYIQDIKNSGSGQPYTHRNSSMGWYDHRRHP